MATRPYEGNQFAYYVPSVNDTSAPTITEIDAGVPLEPGMVATGLAPNHTENLVSTPMLSGFIRQNVGTEGITFNLQFVYDPDTDDTDDIEQLFDSRGKQGFLVLTEEEAAADGRAEVYSASFGRRKRIQSAQDTDKQFSVLCAVNADYDDDATIAAAA